MSWDLNIQTLAFGSWKFKSVSHGVLELHRRHRFDKTVTAFDAMGKYSLIGIAHIRKGSILYHSKNGNDVVGGHLYGIYLPPGCVIHATMKSAHQDLICFVMEKPLSELGTNAFLFEVSRDNLPNSLSELTSYVHKIKNKQLIEYNKSSTAIADKIKNKIDQQYKSPVNLSEVASKLRISATVMGRTFKGNFGISPVKYRNHLRILEATHLLMKGTAVTYAFQEVGFEDLGRFIKQFKKVTGSLPRKYKVSNKSRKTPS